MWLGSYTSQSLSIQNLNLKWCYIPVESHCKISVGGPCDIKKLFTSVRIPIVQADTIVVFFNGDRSNALLPMQWKYFTFVHEWSYLCSRNCWYLCVHVSAISLICQNWVYLQGSLELCTKLTCLWLELNLHKEQWLWRLWKVGRFAMLMGVSLYGYMQLYPWEVESCTAMIHTTHTHTHTHTHTLSCYIGFFDQNEVDKIMEESVKMKQFSHPNVMSLIGVCIDAGPAPYIIMPFMANGSLLSYLRKERPNLLLNETADEDLVRISIVLQPIHPKLLYST